MRRLTKGHCSALDRKHKHPTNVFPEITCYIVLTPPALSLWWRKACCWPPLFLCWESDESVRGVDNACVTMSLLQVVFLLRPSNISFLEYSVTARIWMCFCFLPSCCRGLAKKTFIYNLWRSCTDATENQLVSNIIWHLPSCTRASWFTQYHNQVKLTTTIAIVQKENVINFPNSNAACG